MTIQEKYELQKEGKHLVLEPEGDKYYIFSGINFHRCGRAYYGVGIEYGPNKSGGVLLLDDVIRLRDFLDKHIQEVAKQKS